MRHESGEKPLLPRDILLAKVKAYRQQSQGGEMEAGVNPEQLSMDVEQDSQLEQARKMAQQVVKSPFDKTDLDVPSFMRKQQSGQDKGVDQ